MFVSNLERYKMLISSVTESIEAENIPQTKWHNTNKTRKNRVKRLSLLFQVSTITRSFSGFTLLLFFFNLIYLYISNRCASKLWVVLPPRTRVSLILTRGDTLVATFYLFYFCWHLRTLLKNSQPQKCRTSITNHTLF